jgi:nucleoside-diphosphate-sugar epimerase
VFHTASPFFLASADPQRELVDVAVKGTANVLGSVVRSGGCVQRVVVTSSFAGACGPCSQPQTAPLGSGVPGFTTIRIRGCWFHHCWGPGMLS